MSPSTTSQVLIVTNGSNASLGICSNQSTLDNCSDQSVMSSHTLLLVGYSLLMPVGVILNGMSLFVFFRWLRPLTVVGIFMCNLALSDLLFSLSLPFRIFYYAEHQWPFGVFLCRFSGSMFHINMYGSCLFLLCINVDRYFAIVHPLRFRHFRRRKVARLTCLAVWFVIVSGSVPAAIVHTSSDCMNGDKVIHRCFEAFLSWHGTVFPLMLVAEVIGFLLPLGAVLYSTCHVFWELCRDQIGGRRRHKKTIRLLIVNLGIFIFCFVPYNTVLVAYGLLRAKVIVDHFNVLPVMKQTLSVTVLLASTNCALDPMIYYFSTDGFQNTLRHLSGKGRDSGVVVSSSKNTQNTLVSTNANSSIDTEKKDMKEGTCTIREREVNGKERKRLIEESEI
ncbi:lysophosphatidic acid receptor 5 [Pelobates fuscus]|uniref:lysophosphatidic acid receptor 5 n=1 Tax=Pelobates fuscus TaxID=191477 RepID=UPI002FE48941